MPYDLYLEEEGSEVDIDTRINNLDNFYHWCASRVLSLDRKYAKEILNSIGAVQGSDGQRTCSYFSFLSLRFSYSDVFLGEKTGGRDNF